MKKIIQLSLCAAMLSVLCSCAGKDDHVMLHLSFDEGKGTLISDSASKLDQAEVNYQFTNALFMDSLEPEWRESGINQGALLFDGCSTYISYDSSEISAGGPSFSISLYCAPRMFEWDDPEAASEGTAKLTALVSQYNKNKKQGFLLGYERFGRLCFEVGTGDQWITVWADAYLERYKWNQIMAVFDGAQGKITVYLNGEKAAEKAIDKGSEIAPAENKDLLIGKNNEAESIAAGTYNMFCGMMDELYLCDKVIGEGEIAPKTEAEIPYEEIALSNILTDDVYKTQYHGGPYQHWMNEPHSPVYYNGRYHLFFQQNITGTYWRNICWGHLVSDDMVSWKPIREAIVPMKDSVVPDGVWSGNAAYDVNGVPLLFFTAGNDSFRKENLISNQNIGVAYPADLSDPDLTEWKVYEELAVIQKEGEGRAGEFRDPYIWKEGDEWNMLICSGSYTEAGGSALLYTTKTLELKEDGSIDMDWKYRGAVYEMADQSMIYGTSWELPILMKVHNESGTKEKYAFVFSPAPAGLADNKIYYFIGDFNRESGKFTPDAEYEGKPRLLDYGDNVFTGPSVYHDEENDEWYMFSIMQDKRSGAEEGSAGWAHSVGLTRRIWLNDDGSDLKMEPYEKLESLQSEILINEKNLSIEDANQHLAALNEDLLYLKVALKPLDENPVSIILKSDGQKEKTVYTWQSQKQIISAMTRSRGKVGSMQDTEGSVSSGDGILYAEFYVDRSLCEGFFNDEKSISVRSYSPPEARGVMIEGNAEIIELYAARMDSIYE